MERQDLTRNGKTQGGLLELGFPLDGGRGALGGVTDRPGASLRVGPG